MSDVFGVDPGPEPAPADEQPGGDYRERTAEPLLPLDAGADPQRLEDGIRAFYRMIFAALHHTLGRGGPPDAFRPTEAELGEMARPAAQVVARSPRAAQVAERGDLVGAVGTPAMYVVSEVERVNTWKREHAGEPAEPPDSDLHGVGIPAEPPPGQADPMPRTSWRPRATRLEGDGS